MPTVLSVENAVHAKREIERLETEGFTRDNIYIFAHDKDREEDIGKALDTESVGVGEKGLFSSMKNVVSKRGDELRTELAATGLSKEEAAEYEEVLDTGKLVIVAKK
ncbi:general stress protein [Planococcus lenghuensis]|uniref:General stress protein n=1 Tax=Planococcus lenghuensis TaxID=2213202 RepID=A0A1Q2KUW7_9BACL|nr:general stress protein [Planococcus lenghuensis]AQQ51914.1 general stress protein [Planococcus lenghuensis]